MLDERAKEIIATIDHSEMLSQYTIGSRFDGVTLNIDKLSTGCKTALNIMYNTDKVFDIRECGDNALDVIYMLPSGNVYCDYPLISFDMDKVYVYEKKGTRVIASYEVDCNLEFNITFITGDSGTGKSAVFSFLQEMAAEDKRLRCLNYLDLKKNYKNMIKQSKRKLFIIDNADLLLDDDLRWYIAMDSQNQYIIIGRNPTGLCLNQDEIMELRSQKTGEITKFDLVHSF